jgi:hypothetical protein
MSFNRHDCRLQGSGVAYIATKQRDVAVLDAVGQDELLDTVNALSGAYLPILSRFRKMGHCRSGWRGLEGTHKSTSLSATPGYRPRISGTNCSKIQ